MTDCKSFVPHQHLGTCLRCGNLACDHTLKSRTIKGYCGCGLVYTEDGATERAWCGRHAHLIDERSTRGTSRYWSRGETPAS